MKKCGMIEYRSVLLVSRLQKTGQGEIKIVGIEIMNPEWIKKVGE